MQRGIGGTLTRALAPEVVSGTRKRQRPDVLSTEEALNEERTWIRGDATRRCEPCTALCLSGGGIRSAAFGLGVLQVLAGRELLGRYDYLSTVSGGGFIGGWLQVLIRERGGVAAAEAALRDPQAPEIASLRSYTNYLTPQVGAFTADTWTAIALYLRNLLLNWLIIVPGLMIAVLALIGHRTVVATFGQPGAWSWIALILAAGMLFVAAHEACLLLPSHRPPDLDAAIDAEGNARRYAPPGRVSARIVWPSLVWILLTPVALHGLLPRGAGWGAIAIVPASYALAMVTAYLLAWLRQWNEAASRALFGVNLLPWLASTLAGAVTIGIAERCYLALGPNDQAEALTTFAPLALTLCHMLQAVIHVGLRQERVFADLDREWLARMDGMILLDAAAWTVFSLCCLDLSALLLPLHWDGVFPRTTWTVAIATFLSGPAAAWLGRQAIARVEKDFSASTAMQWPLRRIVDVLAAVFLVGLFALFGVVLQLLLGFVQQKLGIGRDHSANMGDFLLLLLLQLAFCALLLAVSRFFSRVNVNRFSLHGVYRNRLSRAFLGSALRDRLAEPFTGFGPLENPRLADFARRFEREADAKLFPVINIALNLTQTTHTAWAERKAASFVATPIACGSAELTGPDGLAGAFVRTPEFAGRTSDYDEGNAHAGIRLGTALTISGAAVSPNWGYNSSPLAAFLMTLFNVRLGAWMPNPARATEADLRFASPRSSRAAIFDELLGRSTDERQSVYLSDGGHFENLGLYEMMRRRCMRILVIDAGQDGECAFADLGNAIRKAAIDGLGSVTMQPMRILSRTAIERDDDANALGLAVGEIEYGEAERGRLVYLKPSYLPAMPAEIRAYGAAHPEFPHESTAEQWFTESQFESYRALGAWQMGTLAQSAAPGDLESLFDHAWRTATTPIEEPSRCCCKGREPREA